MRTRSVAFVLLLGAPSMVMCQLRPRRVGGAGVNAMGQQEEVADPGAGGLEGLEGSLGGFDPSSLGGLDPSKISEMMGDPTKLAEMVANMDLSNNPLMKTLASSNPELAKLMDNPELMKEKMAEAAEAMSSPEGKNMAQNMMQEMQNVLSDPDKLQEGLQALKDNPALKGIADAVPGLKDILDDPDALREQTEKTAEMFKQFQDPQQLQELMAQAGGLEGIQEKMAQMVQALGGEDGSDEAAAMAQMLSGLGGDAGDGGTDSLKDRVDRLMQAHGVGGGAEIEDEF